MYRMLATIRTRALRSLIPPPRLALSSWIEKNIKLPEGVSALPGPVRLWPYQRGIADAISDPLIERITLVKPVRVGFTTLLTGAIAPYLLSVTAFVRIGAAQEVFPSQELILDKGKSTKSKTLYAVSGIAGIHSQKLGNALRTIDTWYPLADESGPIAVEPYGSVTTQGRAFRQPRDKTDFYTLLDNWLIRDQVPPAANQHFVMATLIRGGVFGDSGKD